MRVRRGVRGTPIPLLLLLLAAPAAAEPVDLADPTPRWVHVAFEMSPREAPGRLDAVYTEPVRAWLRPAARREWRLLAVPGEAVERVLARERPEPGSFSEFVWLLDAATGHVLAAHLTGTVHRPLRLGPFRVDAEAELEVEVGTEAGLGFRPPDRVLGQTVFAPCRDATAEDCRWVAPSAYRPETGYVNAVGVIRARWKAITAETFATLGEARLSELPAPTAPLLRTAHSAGGDEPSSAP